MSHASVVADVFASMPVAPSACVIRCGVSGAGATTEMSSSSTSLVYGIVAPCGLASISRT